MTLNFQVQDDSKMIAVSYNENMTAENFMLDYLAKNTNYKSLDGNIVTFIASGRCWNSPKNLKKPLKDLIRNNGIVKFIRKDDLHY